MLVHTKNKYSQKELNNFIKENIEKILKLLIQYLNKNEKIEKFIVKRRKEEIVED